MVRDVTTPFGGHPLEVQAIGLVGNLDGTGGDPPPSGFRQMLLTEMQKRNVKFPNQVLASPNTSLVLVKGQLTPGIQKGDRFDIEVFVPQEHAEVTSLRDGVMYEARLSEQAFVGGRLRKGKVLALAKGRLLVDPLADPEHDMGELRRGLILGGGVALESRPIGLLIRPEYKNIRISAQMGAAINRRFYHTERGIKAGVAVPKTDSYIELVMHPRYKDNINRYIEVILSIPVTESTTQRQLRMRHLGRQLLDPLTSAVAALHLEAIGLDSREILSAGLASDNAEVRFHAAEALAYLDVADAAESVAQTAREQPAFRAAALTALGSMDEPAARDQLLQLLDVNSAETRYGAFRALWAMNHRDPLVRGENLGGKFSYHLVRSEGPPMVHVTRSFRPEIVLFGADLMLRTPVILDAGKNIHVNGSGPETVDVVKIVPGEFEEKRQVSARVDEVVRAIVDLGGSYPDVVQALAQAKTIRSLDCRLEVDALPEWQRRYDRADPPVAAGSQGTAVAQAEAVVSGDREFQKEEVAAGGEGEIGKISVDKDRRWSLHRRVGRIFDSFSD
jgi:hypothetical protein